MKPVLIVVASVLLLAGCSSAPAPLESAYLTVAKTVPTMSTWSDAKLVDFAKNFCAAFEGSDTLGGSGWAPSVKVMTDAGIPSTQANLVVNASVGAYCPEYRDQIPKDMQ